MIPAWRRRWRRTESFTPRLYGRRCRSRRLLPALGKTSCPSTTAGVVRWREVLATGREDDRLVLGDRDGVLGVGTSGAVAAAEGPAVGVGVDLVGALAEPRLDGDDEARSQHEPAPTTPVVGDVGVAVHGAADAVPAEVGVDLVAGVPGDLGD